ncbi:MAG: peptidoglycan bridge formation glycyltransferase FemA/FemB family protein [Proteobacteria bacterium]|nr:peptidoglycan bridge formation glycyltransferase FemA/FemB family protein [Pseudomonadota bacterium]
MSTSTTIDWQNHSVRRWSAVLENLPRSAVEQTWAFGEAVRIHARRQIRRGIIVHNGQDIGLLQAQGRQMGPITFWLLARGPAFIADTPKEVSDTAHKLTCDAFPIRKGDILLWMPEKTDSPQSYAEMADLGKRQLITGYHSAWLDLKKTEEEILEKAHSSWRRNLKTIQKKGLKTQLNHTGKTLTWLLEQADAHRKSGGYSGTSGAFAHLVSGLTSQRGDVITLTAAIENTPVAGMLFLKHGTSATYYIGWNGESGRKLNAHHLLLWEAIKELKKRGVTWMDLGGINTDDATGVAHFKLGIHPEVYSLAGLFG